VALWALAKLSGETAIMATIPPLRTMSQVFWFRVARDLVSGIFVDFYCVQYLVWGFGVWDVCCFDGSKGLMFNLTTLKTRALPL
jgi:hypothetical protein